MYLLYSVWSKLETVKSAVMKNIFDNNIDSVVPSITLSVTAGGGNGTTIFNSIQDAIDYAVGIPSFRYKVVDIKLLDAIYRISSPITIPQNKFKKIRIISELDGKSVIDGSVELSNPSWTYEGNGVYRCNIGQLNIDDLFVNGKRSLKYSSPLEPFDRIPFSFPTAGTDSNYSNGVYHYPVKLGGNGYDDNGLFDKIQNSLLTNPYIVLGATFFSCIAHVESVGTYSSQDNSLLLNCCSGQDLPKNRNSAYLAMIFGFSKLGYDGQWYMDSTGSSNVLYYKIKDGEDISRLSFSYSTLESGIDICGTETDSVNNISIENVELRCFYNKIDKYGYYDNQVVTYNEDGSGDKRTIRLEYCNNVEIKNCDIHDGVGSAILLGKYVKKVVIYHNHIYNTPVNGIAISKARDVSIDNNIINDIGTFTIGSCGIRSNYTSNISITHNEIFKTKWCGIAFGSDFHFNDVDCYNNYIGYNHIHHCLNGYTSDAALLYMIGKNVGTIVEYNYLHDCFGQTNSHNVGIYFDHGVGGVTVRYNVVSCCYTGSINTNPCMHNTLYNNIFAFGGTQQLSINSKWHTTAGDYQYIKERFWSFYHNIVLFDTGVLFGYNNPYGFYEGTRHIYQDNNLFYDLNHDKDDVSINSSLFGKTIDIKSLWQNPNFNNVESVETLDYSLTPENEAFLDEMDVEYKKPFRNIDLSNTGTTDRSQEWQDKCTLDQSWLAAFKQMVISNYPKRPNIYNS